MIEKQVEQILERAGLKKTAGRKAVLKTLLENRQPLSQQEISQKLPLGVNFNYVSIYRSLEAFLRAGIIHRVDTGDRIWRFALCGCKRRGHCHPHFICNYCGKTECLHEIQIPRYDGEEVKEGYLVEEQEYYLRGLCSECAEANVLKGKKTSPLYPPSR